MKITTNQTKYILFIFCFSLILFRLLNISIYTEGRARSAILGDAFSDKNTISSAKFFLDSGFTQTSFLPVHEYYPATEAAHQVYTHYPALPNILAGIYAVIFQSIDERLLRIIPYLIATFFFFIIFRLLNKLLDNEKAALIGAASLWLGSYFINWADNLHQHLYGEFLKWIYVFLLYIYYETDRKNQIYFFLMLLIMALEVNISFEQPVFLGMATLGFSIIYKKGVFSKETISAAIALFFGLFLHLYQNAVYFGSFKAAVDDLIHAYTFRATGAETVGYIKEKEYTWKNFPEIMFGWFNGMERFYVLPGWSLLILWLIFWKEIKLNQNKLFQISLSLFVASIAWGFVMSQHAYIHAFTNKHFSIFVGLSMALLIPLYIKKLKIDFAGVELKWKVFHIVFIAYNLIMFLTQTVWEIWLEFGFLYPHFGT
jgi:hypothetical protein